MVHAIMWWLGFLECALGHMGQVTIAAAVRWAVAFCFVTSCCMGIGKDIDEEECCSLVNVWEPFRIRVRKDGAIFVKWI